MDELTAACCARPASPWPGVDIDELGSDVAENLQPELPHAHDSGGYRRRGTDGCPQQSGVHEDDDNGERVASV